MPLEYGAPSRMDGQLEALAPKLGLSLTATERERLLAYMALIQRWTKVYNLTAVRNTGEMFTHHLLDCLAVVIPLRRGTGETGQGALRLLDVGSGAGLPGVILAMLNPAWRVTCVDAVAKKAAFIRQAAAFLDAMEGLQSPACDLAEATQTLRVNLAILASSRRREWQSVLADSEVTPAAISLLLVHLKKKRFKGFSNPNATAAEHAA